jgi:hypothetical protein
MYYERTFQKPMFFRSAFLIKTGITCMYPYAKKCFSKLRKVGINDGPSSFPLADRLLVDAQARNTGVLDRETVEVQAWKQKSRL